MASRSFSDSKLPLAEIEIEEEIAKKEKRQLERTRAAVVAHNDKRDSRTGETIVSKMCREHPERCAVRCCSRRRGVIVWLVHEN